ncbi:MAG: hypothetical protein PUD98_01590, partial [Bacteroidales bacterium]|nr:hypothetical protein [Bacteroidales bacterium]
MKIFSHFFSPLMFKNCFINFLINLKNHSFISRIIRFIRSIRVIRVQKRVQNVFKTCSKRIQNVWGEKVEGKSGGGTSVGEVFFEVGQGLFPTFFRF